MAYQSDGKTGGSGATAGPRCEKPVAKMLPGCASATGGPSNFHVISQVNVANDDTIGVHLGGGGDNANKTWSWNSNGCGPVSAIASLRWFIEQGLVTNATQAIQDLVKQSSVDPTAYYKVLFPKLAANEQKPTGTSSDIANTNGRVPWIMGKTEAAMDWEAVKQAVCAAAPGLQYTDAPKPTDLCSLAALLNQPVIILLADPGHYTTVHGIVSGRVRVADPGLIVFKDWGNDEKLIYRGSGTPAEIASNQTLKQSASGANAYLSVTPETFFPHVVSAGYFHL